MSRDGTIIMITESTFKVIYSICDTLVILANQKPSHFSPSNNSMAALYISSENNREAIIRFYSPMYEQTNIVAKNCRSITMKYFNLSDVHNSNPTTLCWTNAVRSENHNSQ